MLCITKSESPTTAQLDSRQAITRLLAARVKLVNQRRLARSACVDVEDSWKLDRQLNTTIIALERSIYLLQRSEHKCLEEVVFLLEQLPSIAGDVLQLIEATRRTGQNIPNGLQLRTNKLILQLEAGCKVLEKMRRTINRENNTGREHRRRKSVDSEVWWAKSDLYRSAWYNDWWYNIGVGSPPGVTAKAQSR